MARGDVVRLAIAEELRGTFTGPEDEVRWVDQRRKAFALYLEREWAQDEDNPGHPGVTGNGARLILTDTWEDELA